MTTKKIAEEHRAGHFWSKVDQSGDCWLWTAYCRPNGYGTYYVRRVPVYPHRFAFELEYGPIPAGLVVRHRCDVKACCRPDHLVLGTGADNARDAFERGRSPAGEQSWHAKLSAVQVDEIRRCAAARGGFGATEAEAIAAFLGVSTAAIQNIVAGRSWRWTAPLDAAMDGATARAQRFALRTEVKAILERAARVPKRLPRLDYYDQVEHQARSVRRPVPGHDAVLRPASTDHPGAELGFKPERGAR